jgi:hypothetical protein
MGSNGSMAFLWGVINHLCGMPLAAGLHIQVKQLSLKVNAGSIELWMVIRKSAVVFITCWTQVLGVACERAGILMGSCGTLHRVKHCECLVFYRFTGCDQNAVALIHQLISPPMTQWMETKLGIIIKSRQQSPFLTRTDRSSRSYAA